MIETITQPWPWYTAGIIIGLIVPALLILGNKHFGISANLPVRHAYPVTFRFSAMIGKKRFGTSFLWEEYW
jgi:hypothetical protein